ncbi:MAG: hypothetical protein LQ351_001257 [Letrouitia transgressa]|nr:MAG: hypothetical protein LQ351_001257 [Letrouitia transgressa]
MIYTIEYNKELAVKARQTFFKHGYDDRIQAFDIIFVDLEFSAYRPIVEQILDSKLLREDAIILVDNGKLMFTTITPKTHNSLVFARSFAVDTGNTANIDSTALGHWRKAGKLVDDFNRFEVAGNNDVLKHSVFPRQVHFVQSIAPSKLQRIEPYYSTIADHFGSPAGSHAPLKTVSYSGLLDNSISDIERLIYACVTDGAFCLDLKDTGDDSQSPSISNMANGIFSIVEKFFDQDLETKMQWEMDCWGSLQIGGYKPAGKHTGAVEGKRDGFENFLLSNALIRSQDKRFEDSHRPALTEGQVGHMAQTDVGSLTLLFTSSPGLQIFQRSSSSWVPATPRPGSVAVNVGDTLSFMSGGRLRSCLHKVIPITGPSGLSETRYSLAFFQRPELSAKFVGGNGREWTGKEWHQTRYKLFRVDNNE